MDTVVGDWDLMAGRPPLVVGAENLTGSFLRKRGSATSSTAKLSRPNPVPSSRMRYQGGSNQSQRMSEEGRVVLRLVDVDPQVSWLVAQAEVLQDGVGEHAVQRHAEEVGCQHPEHVGHDVENHDAQAPFPGHAGRFHEGPVPQRDRLRTKDPGAPAQPVVVRTDMIVVTLLFCA